VFVVGDTIYPPGSDQETEYVEAFDASNGQRQWIS
jgi:hypothetical protein